MMKTITIDLAIQQDEKESAFLVKAVKAALQAFRKTYFEERQRYEDSRNQSQPTDTVAIPHNTYQRQES